MHSREITDIIMSFPDTDRIGWLIRFKGKINTLDMLRAVPENQISVMLKEYSEIIASYDENELTELIIALPEKSKIKLLVENKKKISSFNFDKILTTISEAEREKMLEEYADDWSLPYIKSVILSLPLENRMELIEKYADNLPFITIDLIKDLPSNDKLRILESYPSKVHISSIIISFPKIYRQALLEKYIDRMEPKDISSVISSLPLEQKYDSLKKYIDRMESKDISSVISSFPPEYRGDLIETYEKRLPVIYIKQIISNIEESEKQNIISRLLEKGNDETKLIYILNLFDSTDKKKEFLEKYSLSDLVDLELHELISQKLENMYEYNRSLLTLLNPKVVEAIGREDLYKYIKYIIVPHEGDGDNLEKILEHPEEFKAYLELRKRFQNQKEMRFMNIHDAIQEFDSNYRLIKLMIDAENIDEKRLRIFEVAVKDKKLTGIETIKDIDRYPIIRRKRIKELIRTSTIDAVYELFVGMSENEYLSVQERSEKIDLIKTLEDMRDNVPSELKEQIEDTLMIFRIIEKVKNLPEDERNKLLRYFNEELSKEFETQSDTNICKFRRQIRDIEKNIRSFFERELDSSLYVSRDAKHEIDDSIEVIHLQGEPFKLLVHAIDAYGGGNGHFEKREVGKSYICTSLISDNFLGHADGTVTIAFTSIGINSLVMEGATDIFSYSERENSRSVYSEGKKAKFSSSDVLIEDTVKEGCRINEVVLYRESEDERGNNQFIVPNYIICFDDINEESREEAQRISEQFGLDKPLPIIVIHSEAYEDRIKEFREKHKRSVDGIDETTYSQHSKVGAEADRRAEELIKGVGERVEDLMKEACERAPIKEKVRVLEEIIKGVGKFFKSKVGKEGDEKDR